MPGAPRLLIWPRVVLRRYRRLAGILTAALAAAGLPAVVRAQDGNTAVCAGCHKNVWETYRRTGMGRSFYRPSPELAVEDFTRKNTFYHQPSDSYFTMLQRDGKYFQRRYQLDSTGKQVNVMEKQVDYVMGSGNHSRAYLHRTAANTLVELPLGLVRREGRLLGDEPRLRPSRSRRLPPPHHLRLHVLPQRLSRDSRPDMSSPSPNPYTPDRSPKASIARGATVPAAGTRSWRPPPGAKPEDIRRAIVNPSRLERAAPDGSMHGVPSGDHQFSAAQCDSALRSAARFPTGRVSPWAISSSTSTTPRAPAGKTSSRSSTRPTACGARPVS